MRAEGKVVVVTGEASGIGGALCRRFAAERPAGVVVGATGSAAVACAEWPALTPWLAGMRRLVARAGG